MIHLIKHWYRNWWVWYLTRNVKRRRKNNVQITSEDAYSRDDHEFKQQGF